MGRLKGYRLYLAAVLIVYVDLAVLAAMLPAARADLQNIVFDQYQRWRPRVRESDLVRTVDIDEESIRRLGQWPWPRQAVARLVQVLSQAHPATISFDILFSEADRSGFVKSSGAARRPLAAASLTASPEAPSEGDAALADAIAGRPVVLGELLMNGHFASPVPAKSGFAIVGRDPSKTLPQLSGVIAPLDVLAEKAAGIGFVNWQADDDRVVRRVPLLMTVNGHMQPSFAIEALRVAQGASTYILKSADAARDETFASSSGLAAIKIGDLVVPTQSAGDVRAYFAKADPRFSTPAWKLFESGADLSGFAGKIVVVGASAAMLSDVVATPLDPSTPGVEAQAQLIEQMLDGASLLRPDWAFGAELLAGLLISLMLVVALPKISALATALLGALAVAALGLVSGLGFVKYGLLLDPVTPSLSSGAVFLAGALALYGQKRQQLTEIRSLFGRFVSAVVVERLADRPEAIKLGGEQRRLTLMFCDLRSFTTLAEHFTAVELTSFLNEYLTPMTDIVLARMGTIDKYMGDAIMAFWNAPLDDAAHAANAARAALDMRRALAELNRRWALGFESGGSVRHLKFGVGLNTGECCVGNLGSTRRLDYSAIGDEVNIASRLEGASKVFGVDIVASASTRDEAPDFAWLEIERVVLKNKTRATAVYALAGDADYAESAVFKSLVERHEKVLAAYRVGDFAAAASAAAAAEGLAPDDLKGLYASYYKPRLSRLAADGVGPGWEPVLALDTK